MTDIPNIADIISGYAKQDKTLRQSAAGLCVMILEMERDEDCRGRQSRRLAELKKLSALQEKLVNRMLSKSIEADEQSKKPHLKLIK